MGSLGKYRSMRDFAATPEPAGGVARGAQALRYSVQCHDATRLHWDLRLEWDGVLLSWAVTRGPSLDPADKRLAVRTEDHPFDYLTFEGVIPQGNYGAGRVMLWDLGWWQPFHGVEQGLSEGHLHFALHGRRATGGWSLVRMKPRGKEKHENWLMLKDRDSAAKDGGKPFAEVFSTSVATNRGFDAIGEGGPAKPFGPARKGAMPSFHPVQLAQVAATPAGEGWLHEVKLDGYRAEVAIGKGGVRIFTRNGHDWTDRFAELAPSLAELPCDAALIDGEIVAGAGLSGFSALQEAIKAGGPFQFFAFDLLHLNGKDMTKQPLAARRAALETLFKAAVPRGMIRLSPAIAVPAAEALATVCDGGGEGIISKLMDAPYRGGRGPAWVKTKCVRRAEFVIIGWQPSQARGRAFSSLVMATVEGGKLTYRGKVGTGFDERRMEELAEAMRPLKRRDAPLDRVPVEARGACWIEPKLIAEIAHAELTRDGHLRHARFVALREDKRADQVALDPQPEDIMSDTSRIQVAGIGISHPDRVIFPDVKVTKLDLARYYADMADRILPGLANRPMSLVRLPEGLDGEKFFQKHVGKGWPEAVRRVTTKDPEGEPEEWLTVTDARGLVGAVQMGVVEFHPWGARLDQLERPERLVFDLDPDEGLDFAPVRDGAFILRDRLADLGLASAPMVSGGKGVHVTLPLKRTATWETAKLFAQLFARLLAEAMPDRFTATLAKRERRGRIFIDYLRNERGATAVAAFSVRARPGAPVAVPVTWEELKGLKGANAFGMTAALERKLADAPPPAPASLNAALLRKLESQTRR